MAEFKLGRIRFVWQGDWAPGTVYVADDVVSNGGKSYICIRNHTASPEFTTDFTSELPKWDIVSDGTSWRSDWEPETPYNPGDVVKYGALIYICEEGHTSATFEEPDFLGLEEDLDKWTPFATSFNWLGDWDIETRYRVNDIVKYGGFTYLCTVSHISASTTTLGLEDDQEKWVLFNEGLNFLGEWTTAVRYRQNDIVKYGGNLWICVNPHTSSNFITNESNWSIFIKGFEFENAWNNSSNYQPGDTVTYGGYTYVAKRNNVGAQPTSNPLDWDVFTRGFKFQGDWSGVTSYLVGDVVRVSGNTYVATADNLNQLPPNESFWSRLNYGIAWTNNAQTYLQVTAANITGTGTGARFDVIRSNTVYTVSVSSGFAGSGYTAGNTLRISGSAVGGLDGSNDLVITVTGATGGAINSISWSGASSTWTSGIVYSVGDVVLYGASSFICVQNHLAASGNRPDNDITAQYWNLLSLGAEIFTLTTPGDLVYYGDNGPTRLPIGVDGQILRSQNGFPEWANYGLINNVVYVGPLGTDEPAPASGLTIDRPWKTVRYALRQIQDGYLNPNVRDLLKHNKQFLMKEVTNWITFTYTVNITAATAGSQVFTCDTTENLSVGMPIEFSGTLGGVVVGTTYYVEAVTSSTQFRISNTLGGIPRTLTTGTGSMTGTLSYDRVTCERDTGLVVEALIYDISRGGTLKTTLAAQSYYTPAGNAYITGNFGTQTIQTIAAYNHLKLLIDNVLANDLTASYQAENGVSYEDRAIQVIDFNLNAEQVGVTKAGQLIDIITNGIAAGSSTAVAPAINPNTTVFIKTGTYNEILPIIVPEYTAIVGDELRTSVIQPAFAVPLLANDTPKTTSALNRIKELIPDLLANTEIVPTEGNNESQQYINGFVGDVTATARINANSVIISDILENGLSAVPTFVYPDPTGYDSGFFEGRRLLSANKAFLQAEITAWIAVQVAGNIPPFSSGFTYDSAACERDVGYIIDAILYDMTYGGNLETIVAARSYFSNGLPVYGSGEKEETIAAYTYLRSIIDDIVRASAIVKSAGNLLTQDTTGTQGSLAAAAFVQERVQEIIDTLDTEDLPDTIAPSLSWVNEVYVNANTAILAKKSIIQSGAINWVNMMYPDLVFDEDICSRDVGYIVDALVYDMMFGSNFRSAKAGMAYRRAISSAEVVINDQLEPTLGVVNFINDAITTITTGVTGSVGNTDASMIVADLADSIKDIINSGLTAIPTLKIPQPTGYNSTLTDLAYAATGNTTGSTATYGNAVAQIVANYDFIKAEVRAWLANPANGFSTIWNSFSASAQDACIRDVGYILDAVRYDLTYGGNTQSLIVGSAYYSNFVLTISQAELPATLAAYNRLRTVLGQVILETTVTKSPTNLLTQDTSGTPGNAASAVFAQDRVDDVIDWINNGAPNATIVPATAWADTEIKAAFDTILDKKVELREDTVYWVEKFWQEIRYNQELCRRDVGYMIDAIAYDLLTGSNFASIIAGRSYYRATTSAQEVVNNEREATVGAVNFLKHKIKRLAATTASAATEIIIDDVIAYINGGAVPSLRWTASESSNANELAAANLIYDNKDFIKAEVIEFINTNYPEIEYNQDVCARDVGYIVDAIRYDLTYGGHFASKQAGLAYYSGGVLQIDGADKTATLAAYAYLKNIVEDVCQDIQLRSPGALQIDVSQTRADALQAVGDSSAATVATGLVDVITDIIDQGTILGVPTITITEIATSNTFTSVAHGLKIGDEVIATATINGLVEGTTYYVKAVPTPDTFTLSTFLDSPVIADFDNGTGLTISVEITKLPDISQVDLSLRQQHINIMGSKQTIKNAVTEYIGNNFPTLVYDQATCKRDVGLILDAVGYDLMLDSNFRSVKAGQSYYRAGAGVVIDGQKTPTVQSFRFLKNLIETYISTVDLAVKRSNSLMDVIINIIEKGDGDTPEINGTVTYKNDLSTIKGRDIIKLNKSFLANEATAWIEANFGGTVTQTASGTNLISTSSAHNLIVGDPIVFEANMFDVIVGGTIYYVASVPSTTTFKISETLSGGELALTGGTGSKKVTYAFDKEACKRDMTEYLTAICYDLDYPGTHKSIKAAELYLNAVNGSLRSDMFYLRNATGARNMTFNGLRGYLTEENEFGTRRPTAGAYTSLDPGYGPTDSESWITNKSPYVQNVSTFGVGCTGCKIDGALHAGGNRSIVSNDFTQILSDGIGVWCTGNNSLTELVSVFAYYNYAGYLADLGGRIRATNGNSSYGTYGVIAEGTDTGEIPLFGFVDNYSQDAVVGEVITDGQNEVLRFEFTNSGTNYSNAEFAISGSGFNASAIDDEFRDSAVFETRLIDLNDGNEFGGEDFVTARNVAQGGDLITIQLAATDTALSNAYAGMRVQITAGTGVGQYANILSYNNGTKVARVYKDSFEPLTVTATTATTNVITVATTRGLFVDMPIYLGSAVGGLSANTAYYITNITSATQFTVSDTEGGSDVTLTTTTGESVPLYAAGWDHAVPGTPIAAGLDLTTGYEVEPRISYTAPGYTATARTMASSSTWGNLTYGNGRFVAVGSSGTATNYSLDGKTWAAGGTVSNTTWTSVAFGGGQGATARAVVGGLGGRGAVLEAVLGTVNTIGLPGPTQVASVRVIDGGVGYSSPPTIKFTAVSGGDGAEAVCTVLNGVIQEVIIVSTGAGYGASPTVTVETDKVSSIEVLTYGKGYTSVPTVTITGGGASVQATATAVLNNTGVLRIDLDTAGVGYTSVPTVTITDPLAKFVAIANGATTTNYLLATSAVTANWTLGNTLPNSNFTSLAYGNGLFIAVGGSGGAGGAASSTDGISWISRTNTSLSAGTYSAVAYGNQTFVAIPTGGNQTSYTTNGITWSTGGNLPSSTTWTSLAYGNGRFVAIASGGRTVAYSLNKGLSWAAATPGLPSSQTWTSIRYGQGLFVAIAQGTDVIATSPDGITWTQRTLTSSSNWKGLVFGNPNKVPTWVVTSNTSGTTAASIKTGAKALGRTSVEDGRIISIRMVEPGSGYAKGSAISSDAATDRIELDSVDNLVNDQPIIFTNVNSAGIESQMVYYIVSGSINTGTNEIQISMIQGSGIAISLEDATFVNATFRAGPIAEIFDPNKTVSAPIEARLGDGSLANPSFSNRGTQNTTATAEVGGDGYADLFQPSTFIAVGGLFDIPEPGSNIEFASIPNAWYKLVTISNIVGEPGNYTATFQISPGLTVLNAPKYGDLITATYKYSQVRLTGHDFLYIGTGNQARTNYPFVDITTAIQNNQQLSSGGGRVFFTSTDQDGNFNVGNLFGVQQSTGTATLDADAFNLSGLQSLQLGGIAVGIGSAVITQFSTDPFFTANSDNIVPTQRAIKSYITAQIGGGQSSLNVNTLTSGVVFIANDTITTTNGGQLNITAKMNFTGGIDGAPVALGFFLQR
jgi:hypothetical protein